MVLRFFLDDFLNSFNVESILFNFNAFIDKSFLKDLYFSFLENYLLIIVIAAVLLIYVDRILKIILYKKNNPSLKYIKYKNILFSFLFFIAVCFSLIIIDFPQFVFSNLFSSKFFEEEYILPEKAKIIAPADKKNLIVINLESMENTFKSMPSEEGNQNLIPNLTKLEKENLSFGNMTEMYGMNWTTSALISQTSAVPVLFSVPKKTQAVSGVYSLGDILSENNYNNLILFGSDSSFGSKEAYYVYHNYNIFDRDDIKKEGYVDEFIWWGVEDQDLYQVAKDKVKELSKDSKPFYLSLLTVDTHFPNGYKCSKCKNDYDFHFDNVISCADQQAYDFVEWAKLQPFYKDTVIVIAGDHLSMDKNYFNMKNVDSNIKRSIYFTIINSSIVPENGKQSNRKFSSLDVYPTIIESLGFDIVDNKLGLGTSLFSENKTLLEKYEYDFVVNELKKGSKYYKENILNKP